MTDPDGRETGHGAHGESYRSIASARFNAELERYLAALGRSTVTASILGRSAPSLDLDQTIVRDVMTRPVVSVAEDAPFKEIVAILSRNRISAVPVTDKTDRVLGVVSETDLIAKVVVGGGAHAHGRGARAGQREARRKAHGETARDLMTAPAVTTRADAPVVDAARQAALARVRRLPVVDRENRLVGIITRSDMLHVFLHDDREIRAHIRDDILVRHFRIDPANVDVQVCNGVVNIRGNIQGKGLSAALADEIRNVAGVVAVHYAISQREVADDHAAGPPRVPLY